MKARKDDHFTNQPDDLIKRTADYLSYGGAQSLATTSKRFMSALSNDYFNGRKDHDLYLLTTYSQLFDVIARALKKYLKEVNPPKRKVTYSEGIDGSYYEYMHIYNKASNRALWFLSMFLAEAMEPKFHILAMHAFLKHGKGRRLSLLVLQEIESVFKNNITPNLEKYLVEKCFYSREKISWMMNRLLEMIDKTTDYRIYDDSSKCIKNDAIAKKILDFNIHLTHQELEADKCVINVNMPNCFIYQLKELIEYTADYLSYSDAQSLATTSKNLFFALDNNYFDQRKHDKCAEQIVNLNKLNLAMQRALEHYLKNINPPTYDDPYDGKEGADPSYYIYDKASNRACWFLSSLKKNLSIAFHILSMYTLLHEGSGKRLSLLLQGEIKTEFNRMLPNLEKILMQINADLSGKITLGQRTLLQWIDDNNNSGHWMPNSIRLSSLSIRELEDLEQKVISLILESDQPKCVIM